MTDCKNFTYYYKNKILIELEYHNHNDYYYN